MALRGSSLAAGAIVPVGGPAGLPGQSIYQAWLTLPGNAGKVLADFIAAQKGQDGASRLADLTDVTDQLKALNKVDAGAQRQALGAAAAAGPAFTGVGAHLEGQAASPISSHGGMTFQNTATTAAAILGPQQPPSYFTHDGHRSVMVVMGDCTAQTTSSYGFYLLNLSTRDGVGQFGTSVAGVDNTSVWALNPTVIDAMANGAVTDGRGRKLIVCEGDISVTSPYTTVVGFALLGSSMAQPAAADGFVVGDLCAANPGVIKWLHAFVVGDGTSNVGYLTGAVALSGANVPGIPNYLNYRDANGLAQAVRFRSLGSGAFAVDATASPNGVKLVPAGPGQFPSVQSFGTDPNPGLVLQAQGTGQVIAQSLFNANKGLYVATSAQFAVPAGLPVYTVATLPTPGQAGRVAYATNLRVLAPSGSYFALQGAGAGTGGLVVDDGSAWRIVGTNQGAAA